MGNVYRKSYFPQGYEEWISKCNFDYPESMSNELYAEMVWNENVIKIIKEIHKHYTNLAIMADTDFEKYIEDRRAQSEEIAIERLIYDALVSKVVCDFWINLINQPIEIIKNYYRDNKPSIEQIFYDIEKKYNLEKTYPAFLVISAYKEYTC